MRESRTGDAFPYRRAIVIGGSMAGLVTARVLSDHFDRVTVTERDQLPAGPQARAGVPQSRHVHLLLLKGQQILERLFPGLERDLTDHGAMSLDHAQDVWWYEFGRWAPRFSSGLKSSFCSRDLLEHTVRQRLASNPKVEFLTRRELVGLMADETKMRVQGVQVRTREDGQYGTTEEITGELLVDASGRESKLPEYLQALGYARPRETKVNSFFGYASRIYEKSDLPQDWKAIVMRAAPPVGRGCVVLPIEGDRWLATLGAPGRDYPPTDDAGFLEFVGTLPDPLLHHVLKDARPLSPINGYRRMENHLRHYERLLRFPENVVVVGDAVCAFNPVYGQGMTVAAQGAALLGDMLRQGDISRFQTRLAKLVKVPWTLATESDFLYPETESNVPRETNPLVARYLKRVTELAMQDRRVRLAFLKVLDLIEPPSALFHPTIVAQVIRYGRGEARLQRPKPVNGQGAHSLSVGKSARK